MAANGIIAATHSHAQMIGVSSFRTSVKAQPAITSWPMDLPVAIVKSRSSFSFKKSDMPTVRITIVKEATRPHHPTVTSCINKRYWILFTYFQVRSRWLLSTQLENNHRL